MRSVGLQQNPDKPSWRLVETAALSPRRTAVPKSRGRKKKLPHGVVPITPRVYEALLEQRKAFVDKFGREPGANDPVFFDPDKDVPTRSALTGEKALRDSGIDPEKAEAFRKLLR
jgi:hypothetical protein